MKKNTSMIIIAIGILLHVYTYFFESQGGFGLFQIQMFLLSVMPYILCFLVWILKKNSVISFTGSIGPLLADLLIYYSVFINPQGSTAPLALLWMPIWNLLILMPTGLLIGYMIDRSARKKTGLLA